MKIVRFSLPGGEIHYGIVENDAIHQISPDIYAGIQKNGQTHKLSDVKLLTPVAPGKIICIGLNYRDHAEELGMELPKFPNMFFKPDTSLLAPGDAIQYPKKHTKRVDYEGELVIVIGKTAKDVPEDAAMDYVLGLTCGNDVTARDLQGAVSQWGVCKSFDTFAPVGPWIETEADPFNLSIRTWVNGQIKQQSNTSNLVFSVPYLVSFLSECMTLNPGDIIFTGTPFGVGPVAPGDVVEIEIDGVGTLSNTVIGNDL